MTEEPDWSVLDKPLPRKSAREGPKGLGGWLILPLIGLGLTPIIAVFTQAGGWGDLSESWAYLSLVQKSFIVVEFLLEVAAFGVAPIVLLVLAFKQLEIFPGLYIIWLWAVPVWLVIDSLVALVVFSGLLTQEDVFDHETVKAIARSIFQALLWTAYMNRSVRVANTFVN